MAASKMLNWGMVLSVIDKATAPLAKITGSLLGLSKASEKSGKAAESLEKLNAAMSELEEALQPANELEEALKRIRQAALDSSFSSTAFVKATQAAMKAGLGEAQALKVADQALRLTAKSGKSAAVAAAELADGYQKAAKASEKWAKVAAAMRVARENVDDFTGRVKAGLASVLAPAAEVETSLAKLGQAIKPSTGSVADALERVKAASIAWSSSHTQSASEYVAVTKIMAAAGLSEADALKATETALRTSTATGQDATAVAQGLAAMYGQFATKSQSATGAIGSLGDTLSRATQLFPTLQVEGLTDALKDVVPAAKTSGVSVDQIVATLGQLGQAGVKGGAAGAALANVLGALDGASKKLGITVVKTSTGQTDLVATLVALEKKYGSVSKMTGTQKKAFDEAFGDSAKTLSLIIGNTQQLSDATKALGASSGAAATAQQALEGTTAAGAQIAQNQIDALKVALAEGVQPAIKEMFPVVKDVLGTFAGFAKENPKLVALVGTLAVLTVTVGMLASPVFSAIGAFASLASALMATAAGQTFMATATTAGVIPALMGAAASAWAFAAALMANPITWIVLAIIAAVALIYIYWEPISEFFLALWATIKDAFSGAWAAIVGVWDKVAGFFGGIFGEIKGAFQESFVKGVVTVLQYLSPITWIVKAFGAILPWLLGLFGEVKAAFQQGFIEGVKKVFFTFTPLGWLLKGWNAVTKWLFGLSLKDAALKVLGTLADGLIGASKWMNDVLLGIGRWIADGVGSIFSFFWQGIQNDLDAVLGFVSGIWTRITSAFDGGIDGVLDLLAEFNPLTLIVDAWDAVTKWLFGFSLKEAGMNIVNTVVEGIRAAANAPAEAMTSVVQKVRDLLPFSPAKAGPLQDLDKVKLVETVADAVNPAPLVDAMSGAAGAAMAAVSSATPGALPVIAPVTMPTIAAEPPAARMGAFASSMPAAAAGGAGPSQMSVTIQLPAGTSPDIMQQFQEWLRQPQNAKVVWGAVQTAARLEGRKELA